MQEYVETKWENKPSVKTKINAHHLNKIEGAVAFSINKITESATLNEDWSPSSGIGLEFNRIGNLVIANFAVSISTITGNHMFIGTVPESMRPLTVTPMPAIFVPTASSDYHPRMIMVNTNGTIQIAKSPTEAGAFFCAMVYFI